MTHNYRIGKALEYVARDFHEGGGIGDVPSGDAVDAGRAQVTLWVHECHPLIDRMISVIHPDDRDLDDPVVALRAQAGGLDVDYCEHVDPLFLIALPSPRHAPGLAPF